MVNINQLITKNFTSQYRLYELKYTVLYYILVLSRSPE